MFASRAALKAFRPTYRMMAPVPKDPQSGHTITQRIRQLSKIPAELIPLGVVVAFAVFAGGYSIVRHFVVDGTIRTKRQNRGIEPVHASGEGHH
ncbi:hypothetical protein F503_00498 [Ophiostoma piceae UAMH 11346]|uniref:Uncharacterized protein n=1 Tax=Ophiostoma piceae (strain UAMH 11346) TaxID=1262450 RepID=S3C795_OPHP1|nr:hypothetical protein F503_00498 [Ophiostoma piceae UAMH 11346]